MDINLGGSMDGFEVTSKIRKISKCPKIIANSGDYIDINEAM